MPTQMLEHPETNVPDPAFEPDRPVQPAFRDEDIRQFESDDTEAGRRIGKILATLFIYTVIAMSVVIWWTFRAVGQ